MRPFGRYLFFIVILELMLGGGGRFTVIPPVSLRMFLFVIAIFYTSWCLLTKKTIERKYYQLTLLFSIILSLSAIIGLVNDADKSLVFEDIKQLSYFFILPFFALIITKKIPSQIGKIVLISSTTLGLLYLVVLALMHSKLVSFIEFYNYTKLSGELFYRGEVAFYFKGFIYLCIGLIFLFFTQPKYKAILAAILILSVTLTFTRGLLFALTLTAMSYIILKQSSVRNKAVKFALISLIGVLIVTKSNFLYTEFGKIISSTSLKDNFTHEFKPEDVLGSRSYSDQIRLTQFKQVLAGTSVPSFFFGHGFGIGVEVRPVHMEISYLEIFHKQGVVGLLFWFLVFTLIVKAYLKVRKNRLANAFFFSSLFIFFQSITNQYFNNAIGMSFVLISLISLDVMGKKDE